LKGVPRVLGPEEVGRFFVKFAHLWPGIIATAFSTFQFLYDTVVDETEAIAKKRSQVDFTGRVGETPDMVSAAAGSRLEACV
jgi:hypothetical protein